MERKQTTKYVVAKQVMNMYTGFNWHVLGLDDCMFGGGDKTPVSVAVIS